MLGFLTVIGNIGKVLNVIGIAIGVLKAAVSVIVDISKKLGLIPEEESAEEIGDRALQAEEAGIVPENYTSFEEYKKAIDEFEIDPEKSKKISEEDKIKKGLVVLTGILEEKYPGASEFVTLTLKNPAFFANNLKDAVINEIKSDPGLMNDIVGMVKGTEKSLEKNENIYDMLMKYYVGDNPEEDISNLKI